MTNDSPVSELRPWYGPVFNLHGKVMKSGFLSHRDRGNKDLWKSSIRQASWPTTVPIVLTRIFAGCVFAGRRFRVIQASEVQRVRLHNEEALPLSLHG